MSIASKIVYLLLLLILISLPHLRIGQVLSVPQATVQSLVILMLLAIGYSMYLLHQRDINRKEKEKKKVEKELELSSDKLIDAFKYIGLVNRRLPLLQQLTTELLSKNNGDKKDAKRIYNELLGTAITSIARKPWGVFRFVDTQTEKTVKEYVYTQKRYAFLKTRVSNRDLLAAQKKKSLYTELGTLCIMATEDKTSREQCFFFFPNKDGGIEEELPVLQAIVDQAQLFYKYLH